MSGLRVPFFRPSIGPDEIAEVVSCLESGWLTTGPKTRQFEADFAAALGGGVEALAVNSATAAMHLGLEALGIGPGDEVICPTLTFTATAEVVRYLGAEPVLADVDPESFCLTPETVAPLIGPRTRAIMPVHFGGRPCDMAGLSALAAPRGIALLDDAAHAFPAANGGHPIGTPGTGAACTAFSFYANKTITTGEGGMLVTANPEIAARARKMRLHGIDRDVFDRFTGRQRSWIYDVVAPGFKYNMTDIAAALGIHQLRRAEGFRDQRAVLVAAYDAAFADLPVRLPPREAPTDRHSWHLYILRLGPEAPMGRDAFMHAMQDAGIGCSLHYRPLHLMTFWRGRIEGGARAFPGADNIYESCVSLPLFMGMRDEEQAHVIQTVRRLLGAAS